MTSSTSKGVSTLLEIELDTKSNKSYLDPSFLKHMRTSTGNNGGDYELCEHLA